MKRIGTPGFVFAREPLAAALTELESALGGLPARHWWSFKTLPLRPALRWWRASGRPVEVVSEFEWRGARDLGFEADAILVNGPAKARWLANRALPGMRVNFDSLGEIIALGRLARDLKWRVGVRVNPTEEVNSEYPGVRSQFGLLPGELGEAARRLKRWGVGVEVVHFHLRTHVPSADWYARAMAEVLEAVQAVGWHPTVLDVGGGVPATGVGSRRGAPLDAGFSLEKLRTMLRQVLRRHPGLREVWMENGRRLAAPSGVLAVRVLEVKEGRGVRTLICDGGRTLHALVATWEHHRVVPLRRRPGPEADTLLCGPTCMAFDNLGRHPLPVATRPGDVLLWLDAGAYQVSWETRFSHGLAGIAWVDGDDVEVVREAEDFESWWRGR